MNIASIQDKANALFHEASFIAAIHNDEEYANALSLMEELIEDYDNNITLIDLLANAIERWENSAPEFAAFNQHLSKMDTGVTLLKVLMDQHQLKAADLKAELGSKTHISMILNGTRNLTKEHIKALSERFHISPALFF